MTSFFEKRDRWGNGLALWVLVALVFLAPLGYLSLRKIHLENDIENWLPADDPSSKALKWYLANFKREDRILVSWEGSSLNDPRVKKLAARLEGREIEEGRRRGGSPYVSGVATPHELVRRMVDEGVEQDQAVRRLTGVLIGTGQLKVKLTEAGRGNRERTIELFTERVRDELGIELEASGAALDWVEESDGDEFALPDDEDASTTADNEQDESELLAFAPIPQHDFRVRWKGMSAGSDTAKRIQEVAETIRMPGFGDDDASGAPLIESCFFSEGAPVALSVAFSEAGLADTTEALEAIRLAGEEVGIPRAAMHVGGRLVAKTALNDKVKASAWDRSYPLPMLHKRSVLLLSGVVSIALSLVLLRSVRLSILVLSVTLYTVYLTVSLVPVTGGNMNMVLVVMPTLLMVLTVSGAIHVANYWKHAACADLRNAVVNAIKMARQPCTLASVTTAIGLLSLTTSPLAPVRDFGLYSAVGCIVSLLMVLYGLPALLQYWPGSAPAQEEVHAGAWRALGRFLSKYHWPVAGAALVALGASAYGLKYFETETKVIRYFPEDSRVVRDYRFLEEGLSGIVPVEVVVRFDKSAQLESNFLERMQLVRKLEERIREHPEISGTLSITDFQPVVEKPEEDAGLLAHRKYNSKAMITEDRIKNERKDSVRSFFVVAETSGDLKTEGDARLNKAGDELWRITAQVAILSDLDYSKLTAQLDEMSRSVLKRHAGSGHVVTGMVPLFLRTQQAVLESLIQSFALAFVVIALVMMVVLKNPAAGAITMLPNLLPVGVVFGLISWAGLRVDIGTMITASVALGIAVDGTLHLLTWFRDGIAKGLTRTDSLSQALAHCGPAMWQTSLVVGIGLLMLAPSELLLISRFGWLMAALIGTALVADMVFLPALLAGPLGTLLERSIKADAEEKEKRSEAPSVQTRTPEPHLNVLQIQGHKKMRTDS